MNPSENTIYSFKVKDLRKNIENLTSEIKDLAVTNLSLEPELQNTREELINLAKDQNQLKQKYVETQSQLSEYCTLFYIFTFSSQGFPFRFIMFRLYKLY